MVKKALDMTLAEVASLCGGYDCCFDCPFFGEDLHSYCRLDVDPYDWEVVCCDLVFDEGGEE